jgi:Transposase DDE domain
MPARRIVRDVNEDARDIARALAKTEAFERSRRHRKSVEMLFAPLKRILRLGRLRLRGRHAVRKMSLPSPQSRRTYTGL